MADEMTVQFDVPGPPSHVMEQWRTLPPHPLAQEGYALADDSYNSLTYEKRYLDWPQKILVVTTLGFALLFKGFFESVFRLTARFDEEGANTKVLLLGVVHPRTQAALREMAAEHGGVTGPPTPSMSSTLLPGSPSS
ncbi:MAG TPA: hypothetical protein VF587_16000 [Solirubrobacteraceae bacterium]|jgi:hypothetical protein